MWVLIPMAGNGQRFVDAGYPDPKPLIPLIHPDGSGRRIIEHVVGMFDAHDEFVFICNTDHVKQGMEKRLNDLGFSGKVLSIGPHKAGPVWTVKAAYDYFGDDEPVMVAYCDSAVKWDRWGFIRHVEENELDGCLLTHTGFHPHTLSRTTKMAFVREDHGKVLEVKEKASFTNDPESEHASSGVYYFRSGKILKRYFDRALAENVTHNGEFYVTLVYNLMIADGLNVGFFDTPGVAILGTPAEVENYQAWATILRGEQVRTEEDAMRCFRYWGSYHESH